MKTRILITNGGLGTDNNLVVYYNANSWQGMRQVIHWVTYLVAKTGKDSWAEVWPEGTFNERNKILMRVTR